MNKFDHKNDYSLYSNKYIDAIENTENYFLPIWRDVEPEIRGCKVVDVGCGSGRYTACLAETYDCRIVGIDGSSYALRKAVERGFEEVHELPDLNNTSLPLKDMSCDFAVNKDVLEHLITPMNLLKEINRILKPGGKFLLHVPNHFPLSGRIKFLFKNNIDPFGFCLGAKSWENPHIRFFTFEDIQKMLMVSGFKMTRNLSYHFPAIPKLNSIPKGIRYRVLHYLTGKFTTNFCCGFTVLAEKIKVNQ